MKERRALPGVCVQCAARPRQDGVARCRRCIEQHRAARHRRVAQGGCIGCSAPAVEGRQRCVKCSERALASNRARDRRRVAEGLCTRCGKRPARHTRKRCDSCLLRDAGRKERVTAYGLRAVPEPPAPVVDEFYVEGEEILGLDRLSDLRSRWLRQSA